MKDCIFAHKLLEWYRQNGRILPWRGTHDPYVIWISEIILQQTRVSQGHDYFLRFMERFPDVYTLASASEDEVLKCWQGLGYYSRARNIHYAARQIVEMGGFPDNYDSIRSLKGVGDYTAAAIASFAFGLPYAVLDGNVYRVLSRYWGVETPIDTTEGKRFFSQLSQSLLPENRKVADYNQAVMDFGAVQCVPQSPDCLACPLCDSCVAYKEMKVKELPVKSHKMQVSERYLHYIYIKVKEELAVFRREGNDIWKSLYEPMLVETEKRCLPDKLFTRTPLSAFVKDKSATVTFLCNEVRHQLTHRTLICSFHLLELDSKPTDEDFGRKAYWMCREEMDYYAFPRLISMQFERFGEIIWEHGD